MTALTRREAATNVIENMPLNIDFPLAELAEQARCGRYRLTKIQMASFLKEWVKLGKMERRLTYITTYGASLPRTVYRRTEK